MAGPHTAQAREYRISNRTSAEPGRGPFDTALLINGRTITPAGTQSSLGDLPLNAVLSPDGTHLLVSNSGAGMQSLQVVDAATGGVVQTLPYTAPASVFVGLAYSPDGRRAYASGGGSNVIHTYDVAPTGTLSATDDISMGVAGSHYPLLGSGPWPVGLSVSPDGSTLYVADNLANAVSVVNTAGATVAAAIPVGSFPYTTLASADGRHVYVSNWGDGTVSVLDAARHTVAATITVGASSTVGAATSHPSAMALGADGLLYVALSNGDGIAVVDTATNRVLRTLSDAPHVRSPLSSSPEGLAVSPDGRFLYVANAGDDDVAVFSLGDRGDDEQQLGRIPTAWYPTAVVVGKDGRTLYVTNGKGRGAGPNDTFYYPDPTRTNPPIIDAVTGYNDGYCTCAFDRYTGSMIEGTLSTVPVPSRRRLRLYTAEVALNNHEDGDVEDGDTEDGDTDDRRRPGNPIPLSGGTSPIKHVIYVIKENRTYDQVLGDEPIGDGDASLTLFPRANTPNLHALAERFGLLDNFYADAEVSADGHNWTDSANASDYNEKMWPQDYSPGITRRNRGYDFEGDSTINLSPGGYLWDAAAAAGISYRDYGEFYAFTTTAPTTSTAGSPCAGPVATSYVGHTLPPGSVLCLPPSSVNPTTTPNLVGHVDPQFRGYDLRYSDLDRVSEWAREFNQFVASGTLPQLEILRLPNDHTAGTRPGFPTPQAYVAQNDAAVGRVVDIVSHSPYWKDTAIFVTEDDAQNGPDHVDAHRTESVVISPYTARSDPYVDHTLYDTAAMVRTIELILGLPPLSQYDANAMPMWRAFTSSPDLRPYSELSESIPVTLTNTLRAYGAHASVLMDFSREDRAPEDALNRVLWHAIKGAHAPYPAITDGSGRVAHRDAD
jgi:YVTN family beta-propeller protein